MAACNRSVGSIRDRGLEISRWKCWLSSLHFNSLIFNSQVLAFGGTLFVYEITQPPRAGAGCKQRAAAENLNKTDLAELCCLRNPATSAGKRWVKNLNKNEFRGNESSAERSCRGGGLDSSQFILNTRRVRKFEKSTIVSHL